MVMKVSGTDTRLVAAGEGERRRAAEALENFSREDLTRYVQLLLDLYRDLQHAPQPRFRTEIGLLKLVYAGQLRPIEESPIRAQRRRRSWCGVDSARGKSAAAPSFRSLGRESACAQTGAGPAACFGSTGGGRPARITGLSLNQIDVFELNEAFAAQSLAVIKELGLDTSRVNVNGGAIALGHPLGCTGAKLTATLLNELCRTGGKYGIVTMCIGAGMGAAGVFERL